MVLRNPPLAEPEKYPGGVKVKPPFEMGVGDFERGEMLFFDGRAAAESEVVN